MEITSEMNNNKKDLWERPADWKAEDRRDCRAENFQQALDRSIFDLVVVAWAECDRPGQTEEAEKTIMVNLTTNLCSLPKTLIRALIDGRVQKAYKENHEVRKFLQHMNGNNDQPSIYYQEFSDAEAILLRLQTLETSFIFLESTLRPIKILQYGRERLSFR